MNIKTILKTTILFILGGGLYVCIELLYRGFSHYSMFILGGICFCIIDSLNEYISWELSVILQSLIGCITITTLEFIFGIIFNVILKMNVWDYSNLPFNVLGQICLPFSIIWIFISFIAIFISDLLRHYLFGEEYPHYHLKTIKNCHKEVQL